MTNPYIISKVKFDANYTCQDCGMKSDKLEAHHQIPGDDNSLVCLCKGCHVKRHYGTYTPNNALNKINPDVWRAMKAAAIMQNLKISEWIEQAIIDKLNNDKGVKK